MKDNRFIELLNLYIDRQISTAETAELEAEIQRNPRRQAVYRQYCHIHSASKMVYETFRANAAEQTASPSGRPATIELFESRRGRSRWAYYAGGLAAAACLAMVFLRQAPVSPVVPATVAQSPVASAKVRPVTPAPVEVARVSEPVPSLVSLRNPATTPDYSAMLAALREQDEEQRSLSSERWQTAQVQSLFDDHVFDTKRNLPAPDPRPVRIRPAATQVESTVFQFQR